MKHTEVAITGGGIIGLATALELAGAGLDVTVFERGRAMAEASSAAAGMLAARDPNSAASLRALAELSAGLYPGFLTRIAELSGERVPVRTRRAIQGEPELPVGFEELTGSELEAAAPGIIANGLRFFCLDEDSLDPRDLARALPKAVQAAGVTLLEETEVAAVTDSSGVVAFETNECRWTAEKFVHATGAWAAQLSGFPIAPRKGQMVMVEEPGPVRLGLVLRIPEIYIVPRGDGRIVIGSTVEDAGFDKQVEQEAIAGLLDKAAALWPPVRESRVVESWAGLRPATPDGLPMIDACCERCWIAGGHFRNGILLAPGTARLLREMILGEPPSVAVTEFDCRRFATAGVVE